MVEIASARWALDQPMDRTRADGNGNLRDMARRLIAASREAGGSAAALARLQSRLFAATNAIDGLRTQNPLTRLTAGSHSNVGGVPVRPSVVAEVTSRPRLGTDVGSSSDDSVVLRRTVARDDVGASFVGDRSGLLTDGSRSVATNLREITVESQLAFGELTRASDRASRTIVRGFESAFGAGREFRDVVRDIASDLSGLGLRSFVMMPLESLARQGLGALFGSFASGIGRLQPRAEGGPVVRDRAFLVGERGPEVFVPNQQGTILPSMGAVSQTIHVHVTGGINDQGRKTPGQVAGLISRELVRANRRNN